jgi:hypothetical protein
MLLVKISSYHISVSSSSHKEMSHIYCTYSSFLQSKKEGNAYCEGYTYPFIRGPVAAPERGQIFFFVSSV